MKTKVTKFQCPVCGKITSGRLPRDSNEVGDGTFRYPRRHKDKDGKPCEGNTEEAIWIDIEIETNKK